MQEDWECRLLKLPELSERSADAVAAEPADHESWRSMSGFVLATIGSAVGLGDVWRFAYVAGSHGGGLFMLVYLALLLLVCLPLLVAELALGKAAQCAPDRVFVTLARRQQDATAPPPGLGLLGWLSVVTAFVALSYYWVISGWVFRYLFLYASSSTEMLAAAAQPGAFQAFTARPFAPLLWHGLVMSLCALIVAAGVRNGIERMSRWLLPALFVLLVALAIYGLTLPGAMQGLRFLFVPDWSQWRDPNLYLAALGQAFFSIGLASGCIMAYGSYARPSTSLPVASLAITLGDTLASVVAGMAIFMAVFSYGHSPTSGPTLAFVTLPDLFARMPAGRIVGLGFFLLLSIAAVTSAVSLLEVPVAVLIQRWRMSRRRATLAAAVAVFITGIPSSLGYGPLGHLGVRLEYGGERLPLLDLIDTVLSEYLLPLNGLAIALVTGWWWLRRSALAASGLDGWSGALWMWLLRFPVPIVIAAVLLGALLAAFGAR